LPAKIVVTPYRGGSRVTLVGTSGKELLSSEVFHEPRAKGATVRSLKSLLGDAVTVEDHTVGTARATTTKPKGGSASSDGATSSVEQDDATSSL
jgi:hypothetical protein